MFFQKKSGKYTQFKFQPVQVLALGIIVILIIGAVILTLPISSNSNKVTPFIDALFTSASAVCVTGLTTIDTGTYWSTFGQVVILILVQIGGLGFMTFSTFAAIILGKRVSLKERLIVRETYNVFDIQGIVKLVIYILLITIAIEGIGAIILTTQFLEDYSISTSIYYGIFHSISSFCNAGFDLFGNFTGYVGYVTNSIVTTTIGILILFGGLGFFVLIELLRYKKGKRLSFHTKIVLLATAFLVFLGSILFFIFENNNNKTIGELPINKKIVTSTFAAITPRSGGISTVPKSEMTEESQSLTILLMFIGASPGSTGGGIKVTTFVVIIATVIGVMKGKENTEIFKKTINKNLVYKATSITFISIVGVFFITILLTMTQKGSFIQLLYEAVSAFCNVGLSLGVTQNLTPFGKILIILAMYVGRVGPLTILFAFAYKQRMQKVPIKYPEDRIMVG